jgi:predicted RecA/RadA family phage recombinase
VITKLLRGEPTVAHLTAPSAVVPGQCVNIGNMPVIAVNRCASGAVGAFAVGGGVYEGVAQTSTGAPVSGSACVFATNVKVGTSTGNILGVALSVSSAVCTFLHQPTGVAVA